jgi:hypothetical protein
MKKEKNPPNSIGVLFGNRRILCMIHQLQHQTAKNITWLFHMTKKNYKIKTGTNKLNEMQNTKKIFRHDEQNIQQLFKCVCCKP